MRSGAWLALAAAALLQTQLAALQKTTGGKQPPSAESASAKPPIRPGQRGSATLQIGGTTRPTRVKVRLKNPGVATLDAGDEQMVVSSGGATNTVTIPLTGVSVGQPEFELTIDHDDLPVVFSKTLRQIVAVTRKRLAGVESLSIPPGRVTYKLDDVIGVLDSVEHEVNALLPENEFAPFRDAMRTHLAKLRERIRARAIPLPRNGGDGGASGIVRVSNRLVQQSQRVDKGATDETFEGLFSLLQKTADDGLHREVCVRTNPTRYDISLTPASYSAGEKSVNADSLLSLAVGEYKVRIRAQGKNVESNTTVDFLTNPYFAIECPVKFAGGDAEACKYLAGQSRPCP